MVGAVEPTDDGGVDGPHAEVDFIGDSQSSRRRSTLARDRPRGTRERKQLAEKRRR